MAEPLDVIGVGAGIGGLCLAQGLRKAGVAVEVFERDRAPGSRWEGYRIHVNPAGRCGRAYRTRYAGVPGDVRPPRRSRVPHRTARRTRRRRGVDQLSARRSRPERGPLRRRPQHLAAAATGRTGRHRALRRRVRPLRARRGRTGGGGVRRREPGHRRCAGRRRRRFLPGSAAVPPARRAGGRGRRRGWPTSCS